jgi:hypothetical protein
MPEKIDNNMLAPCGMNCMVCCVHLKKKKPCRGCLCDDTDKPEICKSCEIKNCAKKREIIYCFKCEDFPCKRIVNLDKSYQKRYQASLIDNSKTIKDNGFEYFFKKEKKRWKCLECGGIISLHDKECSECGCKI